MKKLYTILLLAICSSLLTLRAQTISTYAGDGISGHMGDGAQATSAEIDNPFYLSTDKLGNVYFVDATNGWLRKVDAISGIITSIAGTGASGFNGDNIQATTANLSNPLGTAEDTAGNIFISDQGASRIRVINASSGIITTVAGNGYPGFAGDGGQATDAEIYYPSGLSIDAAGNLYISDALNARVRMVTKSSGIITTIAGNGVAGYSGDGGPATAAEIKQPFGNIVDGAGNVYLADGENNVVRMISSTGIITTIAGDSVAGYYGDGGQATAAELNFCYNLAFDPGGNIYIADPNNWVIRELNIASGIITTVAGNNAYGQGWSGDGGPAINAELNYPLGVATDLMGNIFIGDISEQRVRKVSSPTTSILPANNTLTSFLYPNPAGKNLNIAFSQSLTGTNVLMVFDLSGKNVLSYATSNPASVISLDVSSLSSGLYLLHIENDNGTVSNQKFIKE